jgi:hypothetical protein
MRMKDNKNRSFQVDINAMKKIKKWSFYTCNQMQYTQQYGNLFILRDVEPSIAIFLITTLSII